MKLECEFCWTFDYTCKVSSAVITEPCTEIEKIRGDHKEGKSNEDVLVMRLNGAVYFVPQGLGAFFPNLTWLEIDNCELKSISRDDLKQFKNLEKLYLNNNELTTLPDDLFYDTPKLTSIWFCNNKIESVSSKLFDPIVNNEFIWIDFLKNIKINAFYAPGHSGSVASVAILMAMIDSQPTAPPYPTDSSQIHLQNFPKGFENLFDSGKFSDFVITVNDSKQFRVHKQILAAHCEGFAELFEEDPGATEMKIEDLSPEAVEKFLRIFYTGKLENFAENSMEIFALAAKLKSLYLKDSIENFVVDQIDDFDALKAFSLAHCFSSERLKRAAFKKIQKIVPERNLPENLIDDLEKVKKIVETWKRLEALVIVEGN